MSGRYSRFFAVLVVSGLLVRMAAGDGRPVYSLEDCLRIGLERSALVANAGRDRAIADAQVWQVGAAALPHLSLQGTYRRLDKVSEITFDERVIRLGSLDNYNVNLSAGQLLYSGGKVNAAIAAARTARRYADAGISAARAAVIRDVSMAFNDVLLARAAVEVRRESVAHLGEMLDEARLKQKHDVASEFEVLSARVRLANERPLLIRAINNLDMTRNTLARLLDLERDDFELDGEVHPAGHDFDDLEAALRHGVAHRPEILQARDLVRMRRHDMDAARADRMPVVRAVANYGAAKPDQDGFGADDAWTPRWNAGLTAEWSIFDGGRRYNIIREKRLQLEKQRENLDELVKNVGLEIRQAWLNMQHAQEAVQGSEENVALAEKALAIAQVRFAQGLSTYLELTETNLALSTARLSRLQALRDQIHAVVNLRYACGPQTDAPRLEE